MYTQCRGVVRLAETPVPSREAVFKSWVLAVRNSKLRSGSPSFYGLLNLRNRQLRDPQHDVEARQTFCCYPFPIYYYFLFVCLFFIIFFPSSLASPVVRQLHCSILVTSHHETKPRLQTQKLMSLLSCPTNRRLTRFSLVTIGTARTLVSGFQHTY
jgi:hypothetical protein